MNGESHEHSPLPQYLRKAVWGTSDLWWKKKSQERNRSKRTSVTVHRQSTAYQPPWQGPEGQASRRCSRQLPCEFEYKSVKLGNCIQCCNMSAVEAAVALRARLQLIRALIVRCAVRTRNRESAAATHIATRARAELAREQQSGTRTESATAHSWGRGSLVRCQAQRPSSTCQSLCGNRSEALQQTDFIMSARCDSGAQQAKFTPQNGIQNAVSESAPSRNARTHG